MKQEDSDFEVRLRVLERMFDRVLDAISTSKVAEKTADKALAMAQECLVVVTSQFRQPTPEASDPLNTLDTAGVGSLADLLPPEPEELMTDPPAPVAERVSGILSKLKAGKERARQKHLQLKGVANEDIPPPPPDGKEDVNDLVDQ